MYAQTRPVLITLPVLSDDGACSGSSPRSTRPVRTELGLILGDYIHNLRGALDHLVNQLAVLAGQAPGRKHQFPIGFTACTSSSVSRPFSGPRSVMKRRVGDRVRERLCRALERQVSDDSLNRHECPSL